MPIKLKLNKSQLSLMLQERKEQIVSFMQTRLLRVAEDFVTNARNVRTYKDHTGNLRSSIGYCLLKNGVPVNVNFEVTAEFAKEKGDEVGIGEQKARELIDEIITRFPRGLVLIVVAGMEYALYVESKGFDVLTGSSLIANSDLQKSLAELMAKIK